MSGSTVHLSEGTNTGVSAHVQVSSEGGASDVEPSKEILNGCLDAIKYNLFNKICAQVLKTKGLVKCPLDRENQERICFPTFGIRSGSISQS